MNSNDVKWKIYIIGHKKIHDDLMAGDDKFNNDNYCFLNVGQLDKLDNSSQYCCLNQKDLVNYIPIGKFWAESEGIYNIWRSGIYKNLDYIGFLHYDIEFCLERRILIGKKKNITERIERYIRGKERAHISFATYTPKLDYAQKIMADVTRPNELTGDGRNCYDYIIEDYNAYFETSYTLEDFFRHKYINLCSCFLIDIKAYEKMMDFFDWLVNSHKLDVFDTEHKYRLQGGLAERYFGVFLLFEYTNMLNLSLVHQYDRGCK